MISMPSSNDAKANQLKLLLAEDLRGLAGTQAYIREAPMNLIYMSHYAKLGSKILHLIKILYGSTSFIDLLVKTQTDIAQWRGRTGEPSKTPQISCHSHQCL